MTNQFLQKYSTLNFQYVYSNHRSAVCTGTCFLNYSLATAILPLREEVTLTSVALASVAEQTVDFLLKSRLNWSFATRQAISYCH